MFECKIYWIYIYKFLPFAFKLLVLEGKYMNAGVV